MYKVLKSEIKEIIEIVNQCPESLKEKCFEILLDNFLKSSQPTTSVIKSSENYTDNKTRDTNIADAPIPDNTIKDEPITEITLKDFHVKLQRFLNNNGITIDAINFLYYKEDNKLMPLYETLKSTNMSECQIRLALLTAFENAFSDSNGDFTFSYNVVRTRCNAMKCYNASNFAAYFKNNSSLWENWPDKIDKETIISLSSEGKKELAKVLIELSDGN